MLAFSYKSYAGHPGFQRFRELSSIEFFLDYSLASVILGVDPLLGKFLKHEYHKSIPFRVAHSQFNIAHPSNVKICIIFHYFFYNAGKKYDVKEFKIKG